MLIPNTDLKLRIQEFVRSQQSRKRPAADSKMAEPDGAAVTDRSIARLAGDALYPFACGLRTCVPICANGHVPLLIFSLNMFHFYSGLILRFRHSQVRFL
jgi:hypothetical protein